MGSHMVTMLQLCECDHLMETWINNLPYSPIFDRGIIREKSWLQGKVLGIKLYLLLLVSKLSKLPIALYYSSPLLSLLNTLK